MPFAKAIANADNLDEARDRAADGNCYGHWSSLQSWGWGHANKQFARMFSTLRLGPVKYNIALDQATRFADSRLHGTRSLRNPASEI